MKSKVDGAKAQQRSAAIPQLLDRLARHASWLVQLVIPPALLTYFFFAWKAAIFEVYPYLRSRGRSKIAIIYVTMGSCLIFSVTALYLRLYFLPKTQSVPPRDPPAAIRERKVMFECLAQPEVEIVKADSSSEPPAAKEEVLVNRCWKGTCNGRWKPARTRHCSECGVCRAGFDHHCAFFANCLTAPHIPAFILLLLLTPITTTFLSFPLYLPLARKIRVAYFVRSSMTDWWWSQWWNRALPAGPVGRHVYGLLLGWRELDRINGDRGGVVSVKNAGLVAIGLILAMITAGLAYNTITAVLAGNLTIDRERHRSHSRVLASIQNLQSNSPVGQVVIPQHLLNQLEYYSTRTTFLVPLSDSGEGEIVSTLAEEQPYDFGERENWVKLMGRGYGWLLPWRALRRAQLSDAELYNWPVVPKVRRRLEHKAEKQYQAREDESE